MQLTKDILVHVHSYDEAVEVLTEFESQGIVGPFDWDIDKLAREWGNYPYLGFSRNSGSEHYTAFSNARGDTRQVVEYEEFMYFEPVVVAGFEALI